MGKNTTVKADALKLIKDVRRAEMFRYVRLELSRIEHSGKHILRYIGIESMCNAHGIDPIGMAVILCTEDGCTVVYDDSTISKSENIAKQRAVEKVIAALV